MTLMCVKSNKSTTKLANVKGALKLRTILYLFLVFLSVQFHSIYGQITTPAPFLTPQQAVEDVLLGVGVNAYNVTINGSLAQGNVVQPTVRRFVNNSLAFPLDEGVILQTQGGPEITDADLSAITSGNVRNGVVLEFDFVPDGDTLSFSYIFASSEYTIFTCSQYNDVFGFFISGPGINGPFTNGAINLATIPGSDTPIAVNTVNSGTPSWGYPPDSCYNANPNWQADAVYFTTSFNPVYNSSGSPTSSYNGSTVEMTANAKLICGETYHIKLAIANCIDPSYQSAVFLRAGSFSSQPTFTVEAGNLVSTDLDSTIVEGCDIGSFCFQRDVEDADSTQVMYFDVTGTATYGVDFVFNGMPLDQDSLVFMPGEVQKCLEFEPINDGVLEGLETVTVSTFSVNKCGDTLYTETTLYIADKPEDFTPDAGADFSVCDGGTGQLQGVEHSATNSTEWSYTGPGTVTFTPNTQALNPTVSFSTPGVYYFTLTEENDTCNVYGEDFVTVVYGAMEISVTNDTTICQNGTANLVATGTSTSGGNITYHWSHTPDINPNQDVSPLTTTTYSVYAENEDGCVSETMDIEVEVLPPFSLEVLPESQSICPGEEAVINTQYEGGDGGSYTFEWEDPAGNIVGNDETLVIYRPVTTDFTVTISDGCETTPITKVATVHHDIIPEVLFSVDEPALCTPAQFEIVNDMDKSLIDEVYWYVSNGDAFTMQDTIIVDEKTPGVYDVQLTAVTPNGCVVTKTESNMLIVYDKPKIYFTYYPHPATVLNTEIKFQNGTVGADSYYWTFEEGSPAYSYATNPTTMLPEETIGSYDVQLIATSEFGCTDTLSKIIQVLPEVRLFAPNSFTPDGDSFNDVWKVSLIGVDIYDVTIEIYNRWGEIIWESHDLDYGWNGTYLHSGERVKTGAYMWRILGKDMITDERYEWNGTVNVLR